MRSIHHVIMNEVKTCSQSACCQEGRLHFSQGLCQDKHLRQKHVIDTSSCENPQRSSASKQDTISGAAPTRYSWLPACADNPNLRTLARFSDTRPVPIKHPELSPTRDYSYSSVQDPKGSAPAKCYGQQEPIFLNVEIPSGFWDTSGPG